MKERNHSCNSNDSYNQFTMKHPITFFDSSDTVQFKNGRFSDKGSFYWVRLTSSQIRTRDDWVQSAKRALPPCCAPSWEGRLRFLKGLKKMETAEQQINFFREDGFKFEAHECSLTCTQTQAHTHMHTLSHTHSHTHTLAQKNVSFKIRFNHSLSKTCWDVKNFSNVMESCIMLLSFNPARDFHISAKFCQQLNDENDS